MKMDNFDGESRSVKVRNLSGFWLLGLCNNFGYVVMLSAAFDILTPVHNNNVTNTTVENGTGKLLEFCNPIGTAAILVADILPCFLIQLTGSFYLHLLSYRLKVWLVILLNVASFVLVSFGGSSVVWLSFLGVIFASLGLGMGECVFLSLTAYFNKNEISTWSSGTGAAGVFGALSYAGLTALHVSLKTTLLIMLIVPCLLGLTYFVLLVKPASVTLGYLPVREESEDIGLTTASSSDELDARQMTFINRLRLVKPLLKFMIPLFLVYFAEYLINQAFFELVYFKDIWLRVEDQYRWYQVIYQIGVFISRSSVNIVQIPQVSIFAILQFANLILFIFQVHYQFIPNIWIVFCVILFEGLLGGCAYVNSFYRISEEKRLEKEQQAAILREEEKEPEAEPQPQETTSPYSELYNPPLYRYIWLLHNVTMVMCPIVAVEFFLMRYVGVIYDVIPDWGDTTDFLVACLHLGGFFYVIVDFCISGIPVRFLHLYQPICFSFTYQIVFFIYTTLTHTENYVYVYNTYWRDARATQRAFVNAFTLSFIEPAALHILCFWLYLLRTFLYSEFNFRMSGSRIVPLEGYTYAGPIEKLGRLVFRGLEWRKKKLEIVRERKVIHKAEVARNKRLKNAANKKLKAK